MKLVRADAALETCKQHLDASGAYGTEVEAILTAYASSVIYAAFEAKARDIVAARGAGDGLDSHVTSFSSVAATRLMRSIKISELAGVTAWFHTDCKNRFQDGLDDEHKHAWGTILSNRHGVAHEGEGSAGGPVSNLTLDELRGLYPKALRVLVILEESIAAPMQAADAASVST